MLHTLTASAIFLIHADCCWTEIFLSNSNSRPWHQQHRLAKAFVCFDLISYVPSTIFQLNRDEGLDGGGGGLVFTIH